MTSIKESTRQSKYLITSGSDTGAQQDAVVNMTDDEARSVSSNLNVTASKIGDIHEDEAPQETQIEQGDLLNLTKQIGSVLKASLTKHGDEITTIKASHISPKGLTIKVEYKPDEEGQTWDDEFKFEIEGDKVNLNNGGQITPICQVAKQSGTLTINKDIAAESLDTFLRNAEKVNIQECDEPLSVFSEAVEKYRVSRTRENLKELFRAARNFKGNTLKEKFKNGVEAYKNNNLVLGEKEPEGGLPSLPTTVSTESLPVEPPTTKEEDQPAQVQDTVWITSGVLMKLLDCTDQTSDKYKRFEELLAKGRSGVISVEDLEEFTNCYTADECPEVPETVGVVSVEYPEEV